jgi:Spy/CpxP family protein refolding chaperone
MMRALLLALGCVLLFALVPARAQDKPAASRTSAEWLAMIQADRKAVVANAMNLTPEQAKKFWPLYEAFQREMAVPRSALTRALNDFVAANYKPTDANAKRLTLEVLASQKEQTRLRDKHFRKMLSALPPHLVARYMQVENKIEAVVAIEEAREIPLAR